ncbi:peroxisomal targeting signal 1 receptor [Octopus bimaculoides]|uniref:peroxisomal targeting signal 1 receptor n=1 Tax=Octopus bimaculoides TaxID=37653 RepID=UPI0022E3FE5E|nr:peroxisomal targeting signal 1 receptor [Octopus bimaculoides]
MAMKNLVEGECGVSNSLLKFTGHFTEDKAFKQVKLKKLMNNLIQFPNLIGFSSEVEKPLALPRDVEWVDEFLHAQNTQAAPETFHMGSLLQEMRQIEEAELFHEPQTAPAIADLAVSSEWAKDFLASESTQNSDMGASASATDSISSAVKWAAEYLDPVNANKDWSQEHEKNQSYQPEDVRRAAQELVDSLNNPRIEDTEFMKFISNVTHGETELRDNEALLGAVNAGDVPEQWVEHFVSEESVKSLVDQWQEEFTKEMGSETISDEQFWENLQKHWEDVDRNVNEGHPWLTEYTDSELYQDYKFASENPLLQQKDPFNAGLEKLKKGDIPNAVLLFEAAVQKDASHAEAWQYLGTTQAENEREPAAIAALKKNQMMEIRDLYIEAARLSPNKIDPDVQDAQLWNKLGASLANSNKSEQAVEAYHHALQLSPGFIRSRYNLGIACINLGVHQSAIEHFLVALNMQRKSEDLMPASMNTSRQVMSMNIWGTLRMTLTIMNRMDLHDACDKFDLELLNREFNMNS